jgi:hypothetical protein
MGCNGCVHFLSFSKDGKLLVSSAEDRIVRLWDLTSNKQIHSWEGEKVESVVFSPARNELAMTGKEGSVWVRDAASGKVIHRINEEVAISGPLAYSPDGRIIALCHHFHIYFWEASTGKPILHIGPGFNWRCQYLAFSPDSRTLATAGGEQVLVWNLTGWGKREPPQRPELTREELKALWADLMGDDAAKAHRAIWALVAKPDQAMPLLKSHLRPVPEDSKQALQWIAELDDDRPEVRKKALAELEKMGQAAAPALRRKLAEQPSTEARRRMEGVLGKLEAAQRKEHLNDRARFSCTVETGGLVVG